MPESLRVQDRPRSLERKTPSPPLSNANDIAAPRMSPSVLTKPPNSDSNKLPAPPASAGSPRVAISSSSATSVRPHRPRPVRPGVRRRQTRHHHVVRPHRLLPRIRSSSCFQPISNPLPCAPSNVRMTRTNVRCDPTPCSGMMGHVSWVRLRGFRRSARPSPSVLDPHPPR